MYSFRYITIYIYTDTYIYKHIRHLKIFLIHKSFKIFQWSGLSVFTLVVLAFFVLLGQPLLHQVFVKVYVTSHCSAALFSLSKSNLTRSNLLEDVR